MKKCQKLMAMLLSLVLSCTCCITALAAETSVPADVQPVKSYVATVGQTYRLPDQVMQNGDSYATSDPKLLTVDPQTGVFTAIAEGTVYIVADNAGQTRYFQVAIQSGQQAADQLPQTWEERINALTLHPVDRSDLSDPYALELYYNRYASLVQPGMTNYEILRTVYDYVIANYRTNTLQRTNLPGSFQCTSYAHELCEALYVVGFDVKYMTGRCTAKTGGWTSHAWSAIEVGDDLLYLDANIPAEHGGNPDTYFLTVPGQNGIYRDDTVNVIEYSKDLMTVTLYPEK